MLQPCPAPQGPVPVRKFPSNECQDGDGNQPWDLQTPSSSMPSTPLLTGGLGQVPLESKASMSSQDRWVLNQPTCWPPLSSLVVQPCRAGNPGLTPCTLGALSNSTSLFRGPCLSGLHGPGKCHVHRELNFTGALHPRGAGPSPGASPQDSPSPGSPGICTTVSTRPRSQLPECICCGSNYAPCPYILANAKHWGELIWR